MKYSVGQKVKIQSLEWYRDNVNRYGIIECGKYEFFEPMNEYCGKVVTIKRIDDDNYRIDADKGAFCWTDEMIEGHAEELLDKEMEEHQRMCDEIMDVQGIKPIEVEMEQIIHCPEGYVFEDENGNVINATKIILEKKQKEYPKTFEECCKVLGLLNVDLCFNADYRSFDASKEQWKRLGLMNQFYQLLICRDAYWKIAGEEIGLGKPWEPTNETVYCISRSDNVIKCSYRGGKSNILEFPTPEMRDAFKENFDPDIEFCKELL